ncbi:hypothetical protein MJ575_25915 [Klebsiella pneumoniae]|nr:hypothetical protein MJ575_25915 [Klebsiella pneumoniae]
MIDYNADKVITTSTDRTVFRELDSIKRRQKNDRPGANTCQSAPSLAFQVRDKDHTNFFPLL